MTAVRGQFDPVTGLPVVITTEEYLLLSEAETLLDLEIASDDTLRLRQIAFPEDPVADVADGSATAATVTTSAITTTATVSTTSTAANTASVDRESFLPRPAEPLAAGRFICAAVVTAILRAGVLEWTASAGFRFAAASNRDRRIVRRTTTAPVISDSPQWAHSTRSPS